MSITERATRALTIPARFCGPPGTGNGGYVCGLLGPGGEVLAVAGALWLTVPRPVPAAAAGGAS
jgi:hypothetical protein